MPKLSTQHARLAGIAASLILITALALLILVSVFGGRHAPQASALTVGQGNNKTVYTLETVSDTAAQAKGLGGRSGLAANTGMLFKYAGTNQRCIWMKDMKFPIDVIWLDSHNRIVSLVSNLRPSTYPQDYCATARYVIELNAGETRSRGLRVGQILQLTAK